MSVDLKSVIANMRDIRNGLYYDNDFSHKDTKRIYSGWCDILKVLSIDPPVIVIYNNITVRGSEDSWKKWMVVHKTECQSAWVPVL